MAHQPDIVYRLHTSRARDSETLLLTEDHLIEEYTAGARHWRRAWPLHDLSPEMEYASGRPEQTGHRLTGAGILLAVALVLYFSDLNARIPLLAPLMALLGVVVLAQGLKGWRVETWTVFRKADGDRATSLIHRGTDSKARAEFEQVLAEMIRRAQHRALGD